MVDVKRSPVIKRLYPSVMRRWAKLTCPSGYCVKRYEGLLWLLDWRNWVDRQVALLGGYEREQVKYLLSEMASGCDVFMDVGANFGLYALQVANSGLAAEVHAFEPDPRNRAQLAGQLFLNGMTDKVKVHAVAVSDKAGSVVLEMAKGESTGHTRVHKEQAGNCSPARVAAVTLDTFMEAEGKNLFLKIDVEGHEAAVLRGAARMLAKNNCFVQVELWPENRDSVVRMLEGAGYKAVHQIDCDYYFRKAR